MKQLILSEDHKLAVINALQFNIDFLDDVILDDVTCDITNIKEVRETVKDNIDGLIVLHKLLIKIENSSYMITFTTDEFIVIKQAVEMSMEVARDSVLDPLWCKGEETIDYTRMLKIRAQLDKNIMLLLNYTDTMLLLNK